MLIIPDSCIPYIEIQRTNYINTVEDYIIDMTNEFKQMLAYIPSECRSIIDIGCGVAGIDVLLFKYYNKPILYLIDKNEKPDKIIYGFSNKTSYYNSWTAVNDMMNSNNIDNGKCHILDEVNKNIVPGKIDLIISLLACGFHFHIEKYLNYILQKIKKSGVLILDIRKSKRNQIDLLKKYFSDIQEIETTNPKTIRICLKGKI